MAMSGFFEGLVSGAFNGADRALDIAGRAAKLREARRAEEAKQDLKSLFDAASEAGGLEKVPDEWFAKVAGNLAATGDIENAFRMYDAGGMIRAAKIRREAEQAWSLLNAGDVETALPILNSTMQRLGGRGTFSGIAQQPDGSLAVQTDRGQLIPAEKLMKWAESVMFTPEQAIKMMLDRQTAEARIRKDESVTARNLMSAQRDAALLPHEIEATKALSQQRRASAGQASALAEQARLRTPTLIEQDQARARKTRIEAEVAERFGPQLAEAELERRRAAAQKAQRPSEQAVAQALDVLSNIGEQFLISHGRLSETGGQTVSPEHLTDPRSPALLPSVQRRVGELVIDGMPPNEAVFTVINQAEILRDVLIENNPELAEDQQTLANILATAIETPEVDLETDDEGDFITLALPDRMVKLYLRRSGSDAED